MLFWTIAGKPKETPKAYLSHQFCLLSLKHPVESFTRQPGHICSRFHPGHQRPDCLQRRHGAYTQLHNVQRDYTGGKLGCYMVLAHFTCIKKSHFQPHKHWRDGSGWAVPSLFNQNWWMDKWRYGQIDGRTDGRSMNGWSIDGYSWSMEWWIIDCLWTDGVWMVYDWMTDSWSVDRWVVYGWIVFWWIDGKVMRNNWTAKGLIERK